MGGGCSAVHRTWRFHRAVSTSQKSAQAYFDQGMRFLWAFNHDESTRSFAKAAQEDPNCAMCYWGLALTVGPNYNLPMMAEPPAKVAWQALEQAEHGADRLRAGDAGGRRALSGRRRCPGADAEAMKNANAWKLAA
jgi:hypothetical protein